MGDHGAWIELSWDSPQTLRRVQITFDTGFQRELTLTSSDGITQGIIRAPQPETVRDYELVAVAADGKETSLAKVTGNHRRLCRHEFPSIQAAAIRVKITATNGDPLARIFEVRAYA